MLFWFLIILMTLIVLGLLLRPWSAASGTGVAQDEDRLRISIYEQNLRELDREFERGQLSSEQHANVRNELELSLLAEVERDKVLKGTGQAAVQQAGRWSAAIPVVLIIMLAVPLYLYLGNPQLNELKKFSQLAANSQEDTPASLDGVASALKKHLAKNPEDANGWLLLADVYTSLQQYEGAIDAFEHLQQLAGDDPDVLLRYANLLVSVNGKFGGKPAELVQRVLAIEPDNYTALFFSGMVADEAGDYKLANQYYSKLLPALQGSPELMQTINQLISRNEQLLKEAGAVDTQTGPMAEPVPAATDTISLRVGVTVSAELTGLYSPEDTLFVYAQALDGPPMPLAVVRDKAGALPLEVVLDDSMAMMPTMKLSGFAKVKLQARISKSGNAQPVAGDLIGVLGEVDVAGVDKLNLVIDSVVP